MGIIMKIHNRTHITLTLDDIEKAIERYIDSEIIEAPNGLDIKFMVHEVYQKESLTGYYKPEFVGAEVTIKEDS
jgi:hypothetical protein